MAASATVLSLAGSEVLVRIIAPQPAELQSPGMYVRDPTVGYRLAPSHRGHLGNRLEYRTRIVTNDHGLRGRAPSEDSCAIRILVLGDSFVFGQGVEEDRTVTEQLARLLSSLTRPVEVLNAGVRGYGTRREVAWLRSFGSSLEPDIVVIGVYLGNDLTDNLVSPADSMLRHGASRLKASFRDNPVTRWAYVHSHLYGMLRRTAKQAWSARHAGGERVEMESVMRNYGVFDDAYQRDALNQTRDAALEFSETVRSMGAVPVAFMIPSQLQVEPVTDLSDADLGMGSAFDLLYPNRIFAEAMTAAEIEFMDLTPAMRGATRRRGDLYFPIDGHWNDRGHALGAHLMAPVLDSIIQARLALPLRGCTRRASDV